MERKRQAVSKLDTAPSRPSETRTPNKRGLSGARRRLVELMQDIYFGRIERLVVRGGEPVFDPSPRVVREIKIGGDNALDSERCGTDFLLKSQVRQFFLELLRVGDGVIERIEVKHGLPFRVIVETPFTNAVNE